MPKQKIIKLELNEDYDFLMLGLVCTVKDYRLCHHINSIINIDMIRQDDIELKINKKGNTDYFSFYEFVNGDEEQYILIGNKGKTTSLINEYKSIDYFFIIKNQFFKNQNERITEKIKNIPFVLGVYSIDASSLKSRDNLLF